MPFSDSLTTPTPFVDPSRLPYGGKTLLECWSLYPQSPQIIIVSALESSLLLTQSTRCYNKEEHQIPIGCQPPKTMPSSPHASSQASLLDIYGEVHCYL